MDLRERIKAGFDAEHLRRYELPEWGDEDGPLEVYARPMTLADLQKIQKYGGQDDVLLGVYTVIFKALDADGQPLFKLADKKLLLTGANPAAVSRLANWIIDASSAAQAAEK